MNTVTVSKPDLLATLKTNRTEHRGIFEKAQVAYRDAMIKELDKALQDARDGKQIKRAFSLPVPEDHTADFDTAIAMVEWEVGNTIDLEQVDFSQYVLNNWRWAASFASNTTSYLTT